MGVVAGIAAIAPGKTLFGGIGFNVFNPALVGWAFVQAAFPTSITTWTPALVSNRFVEFILSTLALAFMKPIPTATERTFFIVLATATSRLTFKAPPAWMEADFDQTVSG